MAKNPTVTTPEGVALVSVSLADTYGKSNAKAGQPMISSSGKPMVMARVKVARGEDTFEGTAFLVPFARKS